MIVEFVLVIIVVLVYGGCVVFLVMDCLVSVCGSNILVVIVVVYGNCVYEKLLMEFDYWVI